MTRIVKIDPINPDLKLIAEVAEVLRNGGLCAFPTETVYGLGADGLNPESVVKIFKVKRRPMDNPLILHVSSHNMFEDVIYQAPEIAYRIIRKLWPGPLTVLVRKSDKVPKEVTAGLPTVAVRCPAHPIALNLIDSLGRPIAAPSANVSGKPSPTRAEHVIEDLMGLIDVIVDGGETFFGIESTIIDLTTDPPTLLRPGPVAPEDLKRVVGIDVVIPSVAKGYSEAEVALSPGIKYKHYSPSTPLILLELTNYRDLDMLVKSIINEASNLRSKGFNIAIIGTNETVEYYIRGGFKVLNLGSRRNLYEVARNLYKVLREVDELGVDIALVEGFNDDEGLGIAIMNRLRKASTKRLVINLT